MYSIAVAGHLCLDLTPQLRDAIGLEPGSLTDVGALRVELGGSVANTGGALTHLGAAVTPYATVGDDELAALLLTKLSDEGFMSPELSVSQGRGTSYSLVVQQPGLDRVFWHHTGANADFDGSSVDVEKFPLLHVGYPPLLPGLSADNGEKLEELFARAQKSGVTTSLDLAVVDPNSEVGQLDWDAILSAVFARCDIASPSLDDLTSAWRIDQPYSPELVDRLATRLIDQGVAIAAISAGEHGLHLRTASAERLAQGGPVLQALGSEWADYSVTVAPLDIGSPVTTTGTGDASTAGLLFGLLRQASPDQAAALAVTCAAAVMSGRRPTPDNVSELFPSLSSVVHPTA